MVVAKGTILAFGLFLPSFALHIVAGATGQGWLFAMAVGLIYLTAMGCPAIALILAGFRNTASPLARLTAGIGAAGGYAFTIGALWATNGRAFAWWEFPLGCALVVAVSGGLLFGWRRLGGASETVQVARRPA